MGCQLARRMIQGKQLKIIWAKKRGRGDEKRVKSLKKQRHKLIDNKVSLPKYTNYHSLIAPLDNIYAVIDKNLYRQFDTMKGDRSEGMLRKIVPFTRTPGSIP